MNKEIDKLKDGKKIFFSFFTSFQIVLKDLCIYLVCAHQYVVADVSSISMFKHFLRHNPREDMDAKSDQTGQQIEGSFYSLFLCI